MRKLKKGGFDLSDLAKSKQILRNGSMVYNLRGPYLWSSARLVMWLFRDAHYFGHAHRLPLRQNC